jgi:hypothetical protein
LAKPKKTEATAEVSNDDKPTLTSVGIHRFGRHWVPYVLKTKGDAVIECKTGEASEKWVAIEAVKISVVQEFFDLE